MNEKENNKVINTNKVVVLVGPTGIGKTEISLALCERFNGEIISCDASQMKRKLNIGTAKIDLTKTKIKHHMIDIIEPDDKFSCASFQKESRRLIDEISKKNKLPFIVGGTGLYASVAVYDYELDDFEKQIIDESKYETLSNIELYNILQDKDPETAKKIHPNNRIRVIRAIECANNGSLISQKQGKKDLVYDALIICLCTSRHLLYQRINERVDRMIEEGFVDEVKNLMNKGYDPFVFPDIGYRQVATYLVEGYPIAQTKEEICKETRHYAKRQMTWFRNQMDCIYVDVNYNYPEETIDEISNIINKFLNQNN